MRVSLLGPVSAETDGVPVRLGGRKQRALFALLALQVNHPVALDRLVHELWRDEPPAQATLSLQSYISRLRRVIASAHPDEDDAAQILTRPPGWALIMPSDQVDAVRFAELAKGGSTLIENAEVAAGAAKLREALALWSGDALADLDDMPFAAVETARLQDLRLSVTESLLWAELHLGRPAVVVELARRMVSENPYREGAWCALMLALYRLGRQADALEAAHELRDALAEGLGLDPSPEARVLQEQILRQDPILKHATRVSASIPAEPAPVDAPDPEERVAAGFVGRHDATAALNMLVSRAAQGRGRFVIVSGPAGMGKSAILRELTTRLRASGAVVLQGGGVGAGASPALWPWVSILRQLVAAEPEITEVARTGGLGATLSLLDPSVGTGTGPDGHVQRSGADPVLARTRLYRAVVDLLETAHRAKPLAVLLDDAHWLDPDTLGLLALAADELICQGVVIAVAMRADEAPEVSAEIDAVAARHPADTVRLPLTGLSAVDVAELVRSTDPVAAHEDLASALVNRTGGNPLFVSELLRLLTSERRLDVASVESVLPHQVREVLRRRIDRLPDRTQSLLTVVALLTRPAELDVLTGVTGSSVEAVLDDAESAVASSLLVEDPAAGRFALSHDLVRQTLEEMLSATRKARMHARIAEVMRAQEQTTPSLLPEIVVEIARHLVLAESIVGANAAIPYLVTVADDARERSAFHLAERALRTALELSGRVGDPARRVILNFELRTRLALQSNLISGSPGSRIFGDTAEREGMLVMPRVDADPMAWWGAQVMHVVEGRALRALESAEGALCQDLSRGITAMVHSVAGLCYFVMGRLELADEHLKLAEEIGEEVRERTRENLDPWIPSMRVSAPAIRSAVSSLIIDEGGAAAHLERARSRAQSSSTELVLVEYFAAWGAAVRGDPRTAFERATAALELAQQLGDTFYLPMSRILFGWASAMLGDAGGVAAARASCAECEAIGLRFQATVHLMLCAEAHARHGELEQARAMVSESRSMAKLTGERTVNDRLELLSETILRSAHDPAQLLHMGSVRRGGPDVPTSE